MSRLIYTRRQFGSPSLLKEQRATPENPSFNLNDPAAWDAFDAGPPSASGIPVTHDTAMKLAAVWQAVSMISGDVAKLYLELYRVDDEGTRTRDESHPAYNMVRWDANDETPAFQFWRTAMVHSLIWGNSYSYIDRNGRGDPIGLYTLLPDRTTPERQNGRVVYVTETTNPAGSPWMRTIPARDVLHVRGMSANGISGLDLVRYAKDAYGTALAVEGFQAKYFRNGIRTGGILMLPREMSEKARNKIEEGFQKTHAGPDNWFKTVILRDGAKFEKSQESLRDSQMVELDEQLVRKVARTFNLSPSRLGLADSVSYNSKAEDNQSYLDTTLSHWLTAITSECRKKLLSQANRDAASHCFEHDTTVLLRLNALSRYQVYAMAKQNKIMTTNEIRKLENMPPIEGGDDIQDAGTPAGGLDKGGDTPPRGPADQSGGEAPVPRNVANSAIAATRRIVYGICSQARHKSQKPAAFIEWIDGGLVSHRSHCREVFGNEALIDGMLAELKTIATTATAETLMSVVDEYTSRKELE